MYSSLRMHSLSEAAAPRRVSAAAMLAGLLALCGILLSAGGTHVSAAGVARVGGMGQGIGANPSLDTCFVVDNSANTATSMNSLAAVEAISANDVWAVGDAGVNGQYSQLLIEHWDGLSWSIIPADPPAGATNSYLFSVSGVPGTDEVWAVGAYSPGIGIRSLVLHWNGRAWSSMKGVNVYGYNNFLYSVDAVSNNDVWAVGYSDYGPGVTRSLVTHWNGSSWTRVPDSDPGAADRWLRGVTANSPDDVWAVGYSYEYTVGYRTFVEHWNGTTWNTVPSPNKGTNNYLYAVSSAGPNDAWAVGRRNVTQNVSTPIAMHWDGTSWSFSTIPYLGGAPGQLSSVQVVGPNDVYAAGHWWTQGYKPYVIHWDGTTWTTTSTQGPGYRYNFIAGVAALPTGDSWIVGEYWTATNIIRTLVEHNNCAAPKVGLGR